MKIATANPIVSIRPRSNEANSEQAEQPALDPDRYKKAPYTTNHQWKSKAGVGLLCVGTGTLGYLGSVAHAIPVVGPAVSGLVGAVVGASAAASAASALPHQPIKTATVLGAIGGAILGTSAGGTNFGNIAMGVAGASIPYGALIAIFSHAE